MVMNILQRRRFNQQSAGGISQSTLYSGLAPYWPLNGNANDAVGSNHLTNNNSVSFAAGKIGQAANFVASSSQYLSIADNATLSMGDIDFTIAAWVSIATRSARRTVVAKIGSVSEGEFLLSAETSGTIRFYVGNGSTFNSVQSAVVTTADWHLVVVWHDSVNNLLGISVDNVTPVTVSWSGGCSDTANAFNIGGRGTTEPFDGLIDNVMIWKRMLTGTERSELWNSGAGVVL